MPASITFWLSVTALIVVLTASGIRTAALVVRGRDRRRLGLTAPGVFPGFRLARRAEHAAAAEDAVPAAAKR